MADRRSTPRDAVRNAADPQQVGKAARADLEQQRKYLEAIGEVMTMANGRLFVWELLARARVFGSVVDVDPHMTYFNAGRQDFGHQLIAELVAADEGMYELMEREARLRGRRERDTRDAAHTRASTDEETD